MKKGGSSLLVILIVLVIVLPGGLWFMGTYEPARLAVVQEQVLGLLHGGVINVDQQVVVDSCVEVPNRKGRWSVRRRTRLVLFSDGSSLYSIYSEAPVTSPQCKER